MKKVSVVTGLALLIVLMVFTWSIAQIEMGKGCQHGTKMMGEGTMSQGKCEGHSVGMMPQMGCCSMGSGMMPQIGCCNMGQGMKMCGMRMCGMMGSEEKMGCCMREFFLCCKKELELTDEQVKSLKSIKMDFLRSKLKKEADLKITQMELEALMDEDEASLNEIESKLRSVEKLKTDMKISHIKAFREAKALLTPEQKEKMKKCHEM